MLPRLLFRFVLAAALAALIAGCSADRGPESSHPAGPGAEPRASPTAAPPVALSQHSLERLAADVLATRYGESARDEALDCWRDDAADDAPYCMRLAQVRHVEEAGRSVLYVLASNIRHPDVADYQYGHVNVGRAAAFAAIVNADGSLGEPLASSSGFSFGSNGYCGCEDAALLRLGAGTHAWHFVSGGVWQGIVATHHVLLSREGSTFRDVAHIPEVTEEDQRHRMRIAVDASDPTRKHFPIIVTKHAVVDAAAAEPSDGGEVVARWVVAPGEADGMYRVADGAGAVPGPGRRP